MPKLTVLEEFDIAIKEQARIAPRGTTSRQLAEDFYDGEPQFMEVFDREWKVEKLASLFMKERAKIRAALNPRRRLGFKLIRQKFKLSTGKEWTDRKSTLKDNRFLLKHLATVDHPLVPEIKRRIEFQQRWSKEKHGVTFDQACKLEAKAQGWLPLGEGE